MERGARRIWYFAGARLTAASWQPPGIADQMTQETFLVSGLDVLVAADLRKAGFARAGHMALGQLRGVANPTKKKGGAEDA